MKTISDTPIYRDVIYIKPNYTKIDKTNSEEIRKLQNSTLLECQGDFVYFTSDKPIAESMIVFQAIKKYCDEVVVETNKHDIWGIYTTHEASNIVRPFPVTFFNWRDVDYTTPSRLQETHTYDVSTHTHEDVEDAVHHFLDQYTPSHIVVLTGISSLAHTLTLQHVLQYVCTELWYEDIKIF